jgi:CheY-like chemotaxis protein
LARKILLADDSVTAQNMGRKILTDAGYEVIAVNNGSAALKKIVEHKPDLIVLDVYMPGYSGLEVCQRIKENRETARIPVLLTVGKLEPFKPEEARRARADAFVVKPFEASELLSAIAKLETKIAPQPEPYKQGRFAKVIASLDGSESSAEEKFGDSDDGWKSRLRFPGKKKNPEPEEAPEPVAPAKTARDLREEPSVHPVIPAPSAPPTHEFERPIPAGIPGDITPEEIAAISAAAARLSEAGTPVFSPNTGWHDTVPQSQPSSQPTAPIATESQPLPLDASGDAVHEATAKPAPFESPVAGMVEPLPSVDLPIASGELSAAGDIAPITFASAHIPEEDAAALEIPAPLQEPAPPPVEPVAVAAPEPVPGALESALAQNNSPELKSSISDLSQPLAIEPLPSSQIVSELPADAVASAQLVPEVQPDLRSEVQREPESQSPPAQPAAGALAPDAVPTAVPDEEVMAALQSLIPANGSAGVQTDSNSASGLVAAVAEFAHAGVPVLRPRWIAEEAIPTAEEAALSLEHEMEKAYAAFAASEAARLLATSAIESLSRPSTDVVTAVAEMAVVGELPHSAPVAATIPMEVSPRAAENNTLHGMAAAAGDGGVTSVGVSIFPEPVAPTHEPQSAAPSAAVAAESALISESTSVSPEPEPGRPVVTDFILAASSAAEAESTVDRALRPAESVSDDAAAASTLSSVPDTTDFHLPALDESAAVPATATADAELDTISAGGTHPMGKHSDSGLGFKMIRQSPAGSKSAAGAAPVSKETFDVPVSASEPAVMAAAAAAETAPAVPPMPATAPDPRAIASIVDSVLAELRPKIVEEIAKKLAESK